MFRRVICTFTVDNWGWYITPMIGVDWTNGPYRIWIGWGRWLWMWELEQKAGKP